MTRQMRYSIFITHLFAMSLLSFGVLMMNGDFLLGLLSYLMPKQSQIILSMREESSYEPRGGNRHGGGEDHNMNIFGENIANRRE